MTDDQAGERESAPPSPRSAQSPRPLGALSAFVRQAPHAIALLDRSMNYVAVSRLWLAAFGSGRGDIVGLTHYDLIPDLPVSWKESHRRALAGETLRDDSDHWRRADGSEVWYRWLVQPWTDEGGAIHGVLIDFEDITAQQQALRQAREAHERFEVLFRYAPVALVVGKIDSGAFVEVNAAFVALSGYARQDVLGRSSSEFGLWQDPAFRTAVYTRLHEEGSVPATDATLRRKDGDLVEVSFSSRRVEIAGEVRFLSMIADMTAQQHARRSLERHQIELEALV
ncbi:MAG: PAS domain S-box protein, partial [Rubrivivax sp.]